MKAANIKFGKQYLCKIGRNMVVVGIRRAIPEGGWIAVAPTGSEIRVKSANRLSPLGPMQKAASRQQEATGAPKAAKQKAAPKGTPTPKKDATAQQGAQEARKTKGGEPPRAGKVSLLDAARSILNSAGKPMSAKAVVDIALAQGIWTTTGKTPAATLYAAIIREIQRKGDDARFAKVAPGLFVAL